MNVKIRNINKINLVLSLFSLIFSFLICVSFVSAATMNYYSLNLSSESFSSGQLLNGVINLTLLNQDSGINVKWSVDDVLKGESTLLDFISRSGIQKTCSNSDCKINYLLSNSGNTEVMNYDLESEDLFGFYISGANVQITDFSFDIEGTSNLASSCDDSSFKIDLLNDGINEYEENTPSAYPCEDFYSASTLDLTTSQWAHVENDWFCEKIEIPKTGQVEILTNTQMGGNGYINVSIFNPEDLEFLGDCSLEINEDDLGTCNISSDTFFIPEEKEYFVCLKNTEYDSDSPYKILIESTSEHSGFKGLSSSPTYSFDLAIYVRPYGFSSFNDGLTFDDEYSLNSNLEGYMQDYLLSKYSNNCTNGCIIPLKIYSNDTNQKINISSINLVYTTIIITTTENKIYKLNTNYPKLNISNQLINFGFLNATAPTTISNNHKFKITLGATSKSDNFDVESTPDVSILNPLQTIPGQSTNFLVIVYPVSLIRPIVSYKWNFGDGTGEQITTEPSIYHTFYNAGDYQVIVTATDNNSVSGSGIFSVSTNLSITSLNNSINQKISELNSFSSKLPYSENWYSELYGVNLTQMNQTLISLKGQLNSSLTQSQLSSINSQILSMNLPEDILDKNKLLESKYFVSFNYIEPLKIAQASDSEGDYNSEYEEQYKNSISVWQDNNLELRYALTSKALVYNDRTEDKLTLVTLSLDPLINLEEVYLIINMPSGVSPSSVMIKDNESYDFVELNNALAFKFSSLSSNKYIYLAIPGVVNYDNLIMFMSPTLDTFLIDQNNSNGSYEKKDVPTVLVISISIVLFVVFFIVLYLIWKDNLAKMKIKTKKSEEIFKNKNDLITLQNYVQSSVSSGIPMETIKKQLLNAGWTNEQADYTIKTLKLK